MIICLGIGLNDFLDSVAEVINKLFKCRIPGCNSDVTGAVVEARTLVSSFATACASTEMQTEYFHG